MIRGQHRYFSAAIRRNSPWVAAGEAERIARTGSGKILDSVHEGRLEALFVTLRRGGCRPECWIRRDSLNRWIAARDAELARYRSRREARGALGLTVYTIVRVAAAGAQHECRLSEVEEGLGAYPDLRRRAVLPQIFGPEQMTRDPSKAFGISDRHKTTVDDGPYYGSESRVAAEIILGGMAQRYDLARLGVLHWRTDPASNSQDAAGGVEASYEGRSEEEVGGVQAG